MHKVNPPSAKEINGVSANVRTALIFAFTAAFFFVAVVIRHWLW